MKAYFYFTSFFLAFVLVSGSCAQQSKNSFETNKRQIYDTCYFDFFQGYSNIHPQGRYTIINDSTGRMANSPDSILYLRITPYFYSSDEIHPYSPYLHIDDIKKCNQLGFLKFETAFDKNLIPKEIDFTWFPELRHVDIDYDGKAFPRNQLEDLLKTASHLKGITFKANYRIPDCLCDLKELRYLKIVNESGKLELPDCIQQMESLKMLAIYRGGNAQLNSVIWNMPSLEFIKIDGGRVVDISPTIKNMKRLKQIVFSTIDSVYVPSEFGQLDSLEMIHFSWINKSVEFPEETKRLKNLKEVELIQMSTPFIPNFSGAGDLRLLKLYELRDLKDNQFDLSKNINLEVINLHFADLYTRQHLPNGIRQMKKLKCFDGSFHSLPKAESDWMYSMNRRNQRPGTCDSSIDYYQVLFERGSTYWANKKKRY